MGRLGRDFGRAVGNLGYLHALGPRARHPLLAETYRPRGFLESAADEWIAAVERHGPDPEALNGLSRVATARGLPDDARIFAEQAQELASSSR